MMRNGFWKWVVILFLGIPVFLIGQVKTERLAAGFGIGPNLGRTDFGVDNRAGFQVNGFLRHHLPGPLEGQVSATLFGKLSRNDENAYRTQLVTTLDYRFLLRLSSAASVSPYIYGGSGVVLFDVAEAPKNPTPNLETKGWRMVIPAGLGFQFKLNEATSLDFHAGYNFAFSDDLDMIVRNQNDGYFNGFVGLTFDIGYKLSDEDSDGLTNKQERSLGTDMYDSDTDNDGISDGFEAMRSKTNPLRNDTDRDGLTDGEELKKYITDPKVADTDADGLSDYDEIRIHKTNPTASDTDRDGLTDSEEVRTYRTYARFKDTDRDGLTDSEEIFKYKSNPRSPDTDQDGLRDQEEVFTHKTNPLKTDTDGDLMNDKDELLANRDPLTPDGFVFEEVLKEGGEVILDGIQFPSGLAIITTDAAAILDNVFISLKNNPDIAVEIRGYTDSVGNYVYNVALSSKRAISVRNFLVKKGIDSKRLVARGFGPEKPIATNATPEGRQKNRRIEFSRIK